MDKKEFVVIFTEAGVVYRGLQELNDEDVMIIRERLEKEERIRKSKRNEVNIKNGHY
ncbi:MAG TPA: hypothetical protein VMX17_14870 [Candidatus Glassbacteria bacterium]|nr:hypothetical protein [Candidatus Glassbacteria bacterium]